LNWIIFIQIRKTIYTLVNNIADTLQQ